QHPDVATDLINLATVLEKKGNGAAAEPVYREVLAIYVNKLPPDDVRIADVKGWLGQLLARRGVHGEAEALLVGAAQVQAIHPMAGHRDIIVTLQALIDAYDAWNATEPGKGSDKWAAHWRGELATWQASTRPASAPSSKKSSSAPVIP